MAQAGCAELQCRVESPDRKEVDKKVNRINCASNNNNGDHNTTDHNLFNNVCRRCSNGNKLINKKLGEVHNCCLIDIRQFNRYNKKTKTRISTDATYTTASTIDKMYTNMNAR